MMKKLITLVIILATLLSSALPVHAANGKVTYSGNAGKCIFEPGTEYSLTDLGKSLMPVLIAMRDWGAEYLRSKNITSHCFMMNKTPN